ncbi:MAG: DUF5378 domain-containing protein [Mycoplasmataceae bacterium]|nr:DUF5378 domain-containing protein [Mycoplasmataceae bacterium]
MNINSCGLVLCLISLFIGLILVAVSPLIRRLTRNYIFWVLIGTVMLILVIYGRFYDGWKDFSKYHNDNGLVTSRAFLLDLCPFLAISLPLSLIVDQKRVTSRILAPFAVFGSIITLFGEVIFNDTGDINAHWNLHWIVFGGNVNPMFFSMHALTLIVGLFVLGNSEPKFFIKTMANCAIFAVSYYSWVSLITFTMHVSCNTSGIREYDWTFGEWSGVASIFGNMSYPAVAIFGFIFSGIFILLIAVAFDFLPKIKYFSFEKPIKKLGN